jgi:hypothetical protein
MDKLKRIGFVIALSILTLFAHAQDTATNTPNADMMRSNGKIYVVVAVIVTIVIGVFIYLFSLDRKISRMEKGEKE